MAWTARVETRANGKDCNTAIIVTHDATGRRFVHESLFAPDCGQEYADEINIRTPWRPDREYWIEITGRKRWWTLIAERERELHRKMEEIQKLYIGNGCYKLDNIMICDMD